MSTWTAVLPDGRIQSPYEIPLKNPDPGFIVGPKIWTLYNNYPIKLRINGSIGGQPLYCYLHICCSSKLGLKYTLANDSTLNLDPLSAESRNDTNDILMFSNQQSTSPGFEFKIYREVNGVNRYIDASGGTEIILMSEIIGYGPASSVTPYNDKWFKFFTGDRSRNQIFFTDYAGTDWNTTSPSRSYHTTPDLGCFRWAYRDIGNNVYELRTESSWAGDYQDWFSLEIENVYIGDIPPTPPEESSSGGRSTVISPLIHVKNCTDLNLEVTRMILVGGFPTILLETNNGTKSIAKIWNNIIIKDTIIGKLPSIIEPPSENYFWDSWISFEDSTNLDDFPPITF